MRSALTVKMRIPELNHIINNCPYLKDERKRFVEKMGKFGITENTPLRIIEKIYFVILVKLIIKIY